MKKQIIIGIFILISLFLYTQEKVGLALSGGGARALAHIGVLKVIDEYGLQIDYIAGTSTGAVIGGLYAIGYSGKEIENIFLELDWSDIFDESIPRADVYIGQKRWLPYANYFFDLDENYFPKLPISFISGNNLINFLFDLTHQSAHDFDDFQIPFRCVATNVLTGEKKVFASGALHEAMRASMSFPTVFLPFELDEQRYIDGGIVSNLPAEIVKEMGADFVIGIKTNSPLKNDADLKNLIDVLEQTVNINISENMKESQNYCDLTISPNLAEFELLDFTKKQEIIARGEKIARKYFTESRFPKRKNKRAKFTNSTQFKLSKIEIKGNNFLSTRKIKEYFKLTENSVYGKDEILLAIRKIYNSQLFSSIYPVVEFNEESILKLKAKEEKREKLGVNISINSDEGISTSLTLNLTNVIQKNSTLLLNTQVGNKSSFISDYVKNYGKHYGAYFRIFTDFSEQFIYSYENQEIDKRVKSFEVNANLGVGIFVSEAFILEGFGYAYNVNLYKDIATFEEREYHSAGIGIKAYHESLDDVTFPMRGAQMLFKFSTAKAGVFSEKGNRKSYSRIRMLLPFNEHISMEYKFEYGSYFENSNEDFDPFYVGGFDSFMNLNYAEMSAPIFKIHTIATRFCLQKKFFADLEIGFLSLGDVDFWQPEKFEYKSFGLKLGYKTILGPIRVGCGTDENFANVQYHFSIGFNFDPFEFSKR
ncbi:MAG: hypothetical protein HN952_05930 [Candidatus Cloacimonetes bacterium]|jgi:NTE family protein|nr:hypothetical protein [Candidatus Cloacimonadota bacterium]MBT6994478.1 hypothetical protein [Candidatus Cloacimonadota bacterium]MBT7469705.1 hypothetical protein [Candidatus Cloacimonadota bacterium]